MTVATCNAIAKGGQRCRARPLIGTHYCVAHSSTITDDQRAAWRATGGANSSNVARARRALPAELLEIDEVASWLGVCFKQVIAGRMDPPVGTAAANIARTLVELNRAAHIEDRIAELERELGITPNRRSS